jgi:hypothetical protein
MTLLDQIIDGSTDTSLAVSDLLRKVQIVATRIGASDIVAWARQELQGYADADLPTYRRQRTNVLGVFSGYGSIIRHNLLETDEFAPLFVVSLRQPLRELEAFANSDGDPSRGWDVGQVKAYESSGAFMISDHDLFSASNVITRQSLRGIIDTVRTKAMEFALELQERFPEAGSTNGPTVSSDTGVAQTVFNITNNITGNGTNVAAGSEIRQRSTVTQGDVESLRAHAETLGLSSEDAQEFAVAIHDEQSIDGTRVHSILSRVRTGALDLTSKVSASVVAGALLEAGKQFLGIS